jgi:hypothetical protein
MSHNYPKPPYPSQKQSMPGSTAMMDPRPDHGEDSYKGSGRLNGMKAVITGGDSGIGRAVAIAYAREGADILISYLSEHDDAKEVETLVEEDAHGGINVEREDDFQQPARFLSKRTADRILADRPAARAHNRGPRSQGRDHTIAGRHMTIRRDRCGQFETSFNLSDQPYYAAEAMLRIPRHKRNEKVNSAYSNLQ